MTLTDALELTAVDKAAIIKLFDGIIDAWNAGDGARFGTGFTNDADFVNVYGMHDRAARSRSAEFTRTCSKPFSRAAAMSTRSPVSACSRLMLRWST
jgi:uncharacterized protein (TIGR02246 family)